VSPRGPGARLRFRPWHEIAHALLDPLQPLRLVAQHGVELIDVKIPGGELFPQAPQFLIPGRD